MKTQLLGLPLIAASQAQKHVTHNEALQIIDRCMQMVWSEEKRPTDTYHFITDTNEYEIKVQPGWISFDNVERALLVFLNGEWQTLVKMP